MPVGELYDRLTAPEIMAYHRLYREHPFGPVADDWRLALLIGAQTGQPASECLPNWTTAETPAIVEVSFDEAMKMIRAQIRG